MSHRRFVVAATAAVLLLGTAGVAAAATFTGTAGDDRLIGTDQDDRINGRGGNDFLNGRGGNDEIRGGAGDDSIMGGEGDDTIRPGEGADFVDAGPGDDRIILELDGERDVIVCGPGIDTVVGLNNEDFVASDCENRVAPRRQPLPLPAQPLE